MQTEFSRTIELIGHEAFDKISNSNILLFGLGGVGGYIAESLARAGVANLTIVDGDVISKSNINRQVFALQSTINQPKTEACKARLKDINPKIKIKTINKFITEKELVKIDFYKYDFVIDAIDTITTKIAIIKKAKKNNTKIISCMGTGNKFCPEMFEIVDIAKTSVCPLAKVVRKLLKEQGITNIPVLYSKETPQKQLSTFPQTPASISTTPSIAGLLIANYVLKNIINK